MSLILLWLWPQILLQCLGPEEVPDSVTIRCRTWQCLYVAWSLRQPAVQAGLQLLCYGTVWQVTKTKTRIQGSFPSLPILASREDRLRTQGLASHLDLRAELSVEEALFRAVVSTGLIIPCQSTLGTEPEWELGLRPARWDSMAVGEKRAQ